MNNKNESQALPVTPTGWRILRYLCHTFYYEKIESMPQAEVLQIVALSNNTTYQNAIKRLEGAGFVVRSWAVSPAGHHHKTIALTDKAWAIAESRLWLSQEAGGFNENY
jgi:DNA-binding MarR family transcriptional regulator